MKNKIAYILSFTLLCVCSVGFSQSIKPRFGIPPAGDNTGRVLTYALVTPTDVVGSDTAKLNLNAFHTIVRLTNPIIDSFAIQFTKVTNCFAGDKVTVLATTGASGAHVLKFVGSNLAYVNGDGRLILTANKVANITFIFDGVRWCEESRMIQL